MACIGMFCAYGLRSKQGLGFPRRNSISNSIAWVSIPGELILPCSINRARYYPIHFIIVMNARTACWRKPSSACPRADIFANTGIQFMQINTLYQLLAMSLQKSPLFDMAETFVTIPDLFNYWLSGEITNEFTNATTTQCFDPRKRDWATPVLERLRYPCASFRTGH